jgi:hypothetical protein
VGQPATRLRDPAISEVAQKGISGAQWQEPEVDDQRSSACGNSHSRFYTKCVAPNRKSADAASVCFLSGHLGCVTGRAGLAMLTSRPPPNAGVQSRIQQFAGPPASRRRIHNCQICLSQDS